MSEAECMPKSVRSPQATWISTRALILSVVGYVLPRQEDRIDDNDAFLFILLGLVILISNGMLVPLNFSHVPGTPSRSR